MSVPVVPDPATFAAADAMQAAYFRAYLDGQRRQLVADMAKHAAELADARDALTIERLRAQLRTVQSERQHVEKLIDRLDGRFAAAPTAP
jgi:hypothetical protein